MNELIEAVGVWWWVLAIAVAVLGAGRLARVVTHDSYPPSAWVRQKWSDWVIRHNHEDWGILFFCFWCFTPWVMVIVIGWFLLGLLVPWILWAWWIFWGWLALSYVASIIVAYDEPERAAAKEEDE